MKHIVKTVSRFLLLGLTMGCGFFALNQKSQAITPNYADGDTSSETKRTFNESDFVGEIEAPSEELEASLIQSNITETSQSLNFAFKTKTIVGYANGSGDFILNISDPAFTGDDKNPVADDFNRYDEETGLPIFDGEVLFILNGYRSGDEVFIPSTMTFEGTFIVNVTTIASHCVTVDGAEYKGDNSWKDLFGDLKYHQIHIPSTITTVNSHAFTGVPDEVTITYEGESIPDGFASDWTDYDTSKIVFNTYGKESNKKQKVGQKINDIGGDSASVNYCLGCQPDGKKYVGDDYDRPLVVQYDIVKKSDPTSLIRTVYDELPLSNTNGSAYDSVGRISDTSYSRLLGYKLGNDEAIDDKSIIFHNIMKFGEGVDIDTSVRYYVKPLLKYSEKLDMSKLISVKASSNSTFLGYSMFSLTMDKNLSLTSEKYPEPHSLYLDVMSDFYEQNKSKIVSGLTEIRYSLYNLYLSSYRFLYKGNNGELKEVIVPISTAISYQTLDNEKNNKVSVILKNSDVAPDFSADKVQEFELVNLTVQMDLLTTSDSGSRAVLAKSQASYKFAYVTVRNDGNFNVFNWNIFLLIFLVGYIALFTGGSFALYKYKKEKYKNDEFRRVNDKKYIKSAILYGLGFLVIAYAIIFIVMRASGFANTIVAFNPTDPLLIAFAIAGLIIGGYFIVLAIKSIKAEQERRRAIRLRLNEDVEDDGTN